MIIGHEKIPRLSYFFIALALVAGYFVTFPHGVSTTPDGQKEIFAALCALGAAAAWGSSTNFSKYLLKNHHPEVITMLRFGITMLIIGLGLLVIPEWRNGFRIPTSTEWLYLLAIACSTGLVAMYIYYRGLKSTPVHVSAILAHLNVPTRAAAVAELVRFESRTAQVERLLARPAIAVMPPSPSAAPRTVPTSDPAPRAPTPQQHRRWRGRPARHTERPMPRARCTGDG